MTPHQKTLDFIATQILALPEGRIQFVAIDGVDGAGKTVFANDLAPLLEKKGRPVIRASVDGFHNPRVVRYRQGKTPETFFRNSYSYEELQRVLLDPLKDPGNRKYILEVYNVDADIPVVVEEKIATPNSILIFDGIFLHRPELKKYWDYSIFLDVAFENSIPRGARRGSGSPDVFAESNIRYIEGQKIYLQECQPKKWATMVVDYNDLDHPAIKNSHPPPN